tara:strand:+ start:104 stop:439 length:336 start_codon:yes stop_codon:yes gene_type:complete
MSLLKIIIVTATIYHATPSQTDSTPFITASGMHINPDCPLCHRWIAVSRDLEGRGLTFGVKVKITGTGYLDGIWTVQDRMNARWTNRIDFLVGEDIQGGKWENVRVEIIRQ